MLYILQVELINGVFEQKTNFYQLKYYKTRSVFASERSCFVDCHGYYHCNIVRTQGNKSVSLPLTLLSVE